MEKKIYLINKTNVSDGLLEVAAETYNTREERDEAWNRLVHDHNNMIQDCYDIRLSDFDWENDYHYEWNDNELEFYCKEDPDMHHDYYKKDVDSIIVQDRVYVVRIDSDDTLHDGEIIQAVKVFSTLDKAKEHLQFCKKDFEESCLSDYDPDEYIIEEDELSYSWYLEGLYDGCHYCVEISTEEVE